MLINIMAWIFMPVKKARGKAGGDERLLGWLVLVLVFDWVLR